MPLDDEKLMRMKFEPLHIDIWKQQRGDASLRVVATQRSLVVVDFGRFEYEG